jgi:hypothetical protein
MKPAKFDYVVPTSLNSDIQARVAAASRGKLA